MKKIVLMFSLCLISLGSMGQEESKVAFDAGVDFYSRYVWRGLLFTDAPSIQPYMSFTKGGFTAMAWGSYATSKNYAEIDLFLSYTTGGLTFNLNDYFTEDERDMASTDFTEWRDSLTNHLVEASIVYTLPTEGFPLVLMTSTFIYGADLDSDLNQNYSTYFEAKYPFTYNDYDMAVFIGGTLSKGYYANDAAIVNLGFNAGYPIKVTDSFSLPVNMSLILHPYNKDVFFVVGVSF
ncbi:MAG: hypothetical protein JEZ14_22105 [Marinilabiliaceae bacterium]|nr:hypothetical protein [Marinilabiliaceae bacterium]